MTTLIHLECSLCGRIFEPGKVLTRCNCGGPLLARYDLENARQGWSREWLGSAPASMWRYTPLLPVTNPACIISLGEGMTPLLRARRLGDKLGAKNLWIKNEGGNPTGSLKARGLACAISMAVELGVRKVTIAPSGNAAAALAAYAAAAGMEARVFVPAGVPQADFIECAACGAQLDLGAELPAGGDWLDMTAWHEPYRLEGNKTLGFEIAEQLRWELPDAVLCPTGAGMALAGMWKAFEEMEAVGWISGKRPKMIAVQAEGCRPWKDAFTLAGGLCEPQPLGGSLILKVLRASGGTAVAVSDSRMLDAGVEMARAEGIFAAPEGAACVAALPNLLEEGVLHPEERILVVSSGSGLKYLHAYSTRFPRYAVTEQDKLGGLITPR